MKNITPSVTLISLSLAAILTGCGGGGGSTSQATTAPVVTPPVVTPPTPTVTPADLQTTVPALTYAASSQEYAFVTAYNNFRAAMGLGLLAQSAALDKAAANHLAYVTTYSTVNGGPIDMSVINTTYNAPTFHIEDATKNGFTGVLVSDRAKFAGYVNTAVTEEGTFGAGVGASASIAGLLATVYHRQGFMSQGIRDVGVAVGKDPAQTTVINLGYGVKSQSNSSDYIGVYPADKQMMVPLFASSEAPNPYPEITDVLNGTQLGTTYPVSLSIKEGMMLTVDTFTVTQTGQTEPVKVRLFTKSSDKSIDPWTAFVVGYGPFKSNTTYNVSFKGSANGVAISKTWSFTTAASCLNVYTCK